MCYVDDKLSDITLFSHVGQFPWAQDMLIMLSIIPRPTTTVNKVRFFFYYLYI